MHYWPARHKINLLLEFSVRAWQETRCYCDKLWMFREIIAVLLAADKAHRLLNVKRGYAHGLCDLED